MRGSVFGYLSVFVFRINHQFFIYYHIHICRIVWSWRVFNCLTHSKIYQKRQHTDTLSNQPTTTRKELTNLKRRKYIYIFFIDFDYFKTNNGHKENVKNEQVKNRHTHTDIPTHTHTEASGTLSITEYFRDSDFQMQVNKIQIRQWALNFSPK